MKWLKGFVARFLEAYGRELRAEDDETYARDRYYRCLTCAESDGHGIPNSCVCQQCLSEEE